MISSISISQFIAGSLFLFQLNRPIPINPDKPLDVCTVLANLNQYRGRIISVRGRWSGDAIEGDTCKMPMPEINRFGVAYVKNMIGFIHSHDSGWDGERPYWEEARAEIARAGRIYEDLNSKGHNVLATFEGRVDDYRADDRSGYGHMGQYRAQLVLVTIKDVVSETSKPVRTPRKTTPIDR